MIREEIYNALARHSDGESAEHVKRFFKTGPGEYGEGDVFLGVKVPLIRKTAGRYGGNLTLENLEDLLLSEIHELRYFALVVMVDRFSHKKSTQKTRKELFDLYMKNRGRVNNWDLVDVSAPQIAGAWLFHADRSILLELARSSNLWDRRIAVVATLFFIKNNEFKPTLSIAEILLDDKEDLIHKAVGWMLREMGKKNFTAQEKFMKLHYRNMPRTMLRYSIEKYPEPLRRAYLER